MNLKIWEVISIVLSAMVGGMYWGPWLALSRSMRTFKAEVFLDIVDRMSRNMESVMTILTPAALLSIAPVLFLSYNQQPRMFYLTLTGFASFVVALLVTVLVEVPIVKQIVTWTAGTLPGNWRQLRDRWGAFHIIRVVALAASPSSSEERSSNPAIGYPRTITNFSGERVNQDLRIISVCPPSTSVRISFRVSLCQPGQRKCLLNNGSSKWGTRDSSCSQVKGDTSRQTNAKLHKGGDFARRVAI